MEFWTKTAQEGRSWLTTALSSRTVLEFFLTDWMHDHHIVYVSNSPLMDDNLLKYPSNGMTSIS